MDVRSAQEDGDECWLLVSCLSDEEEMEREKVRHFLQQPCCPEAKEHYLLSLLSMSNCMDSKWANRTLELIEVICRCCSIGAGAVLNFYFLESVSVCMLPLLSFKLITNSCCRLSSTSLGSGLHSTRSATYQYSQLLSTPS